MTALTLWYSFVMFSFFSSTDWLVANMDRVRVFEFCIGTRLLLRESHSERLRAAKGLSIEIKTFFKVIRGAVAPNL